ncbi:hypothetical protein A7K93_04925 [Candidatus Methylacidiphilum fumarolicum]|nr:hypothetical protein A7K73_06945 [Candidatus Methylacidiphilum fumarolicum]TFE74037.1 hypothetical protein A7K93_04925 [Candidatus Methylacidiphilum fumarolicum]TFE74145.1 hypothetical protein A7D33_02075 [Candidatus Methylacidiphilum fumarolicum]TFE74937.1 hypothetical protein A7K72_02875 [Candidatus Methylacidiphilum fumarolicum]
MGGQCPGSQRQTVAGIRECEKSKSQAIQAPRPHRQYPAGHLKQAHLQPYPTVSSHCYQRLESGREAVKLSPGLVHCRHECFRVPAATGIQGGMVW